MDQNGGFASQPVPSKQTEPRVESAEEIEQSEVLAENKTNDTCIRNQRTPKGADAHQSQLPTEGSPQEDASKEGYITGAVFFIELFILAALLIRYNNFYLTHVQVPNGKISGAEILKNYLTNVSSILAGLAALNTTINSILSDNFSKKHRMLSSIFKYSGITLAALTAVLGLCTIFIL